MKVWWWQKSVCTQETKKLLRLMGVPVVVS